MISKPLITSMCVALLLASHARAEDPLPIEAYRAQFQNAASDGNLAFVRAALESGIGVDEVDEIGRTALITAAGAGKVEVVEFLLSKKASTDLVYSTVPAQGILGSTQWSDRTALHDAARAGHARIVELLITHKANVNQSASFHGFMNTERSTPLCEAVGSGKIETVKLLLDAGAEVNGAGTSGMFSSSERPLSSAIQTGNGDIVYLLIQNKAEVVDSDLALAIGTGNVEICKAIIAKGANVFQRTGDDHSLLDSAIDARAYHISDGDGTRMAGFDAIIKLLEKYGVQASPPSTKPAE